MIASGSAPATIRQTWWLPRAQEKEETQKLPKRYTQNLSKIKEKGAKTIKTDQRAVEI